MTIQQSGGTEAQSTLLKLLQFEQELRRARTKQEIAYKLVNQLRVVVGFDTASLFSIAGSKVQPVQASDVARLDPNAPFIRWQMLVIKQFLKKDSCRNTGYLHLDEYSEFDPRSFAEWGRKSALWLPLLSPEGELLAGLWIHRGVPFREDQIALFDRIAEVAGHAWNALGHHRRVKLNPTKKKVTFLIAGAAALASLFIPVDLSVLAPAEVVAHDPSIVTAPLNGVVASVAVSPNDRVSAGQMLARYDDTDAVGRLAVAEEELLVAQSELLSARQASLVDPRVKGEVAILESRFQLRQTERDYAREILNKIEIRSPRNGVVVFRDRADIEGVPVETGQAIFQIAEPNDTELRIELPISDAISFEKNSEITLFLDQSPLTPVSAKLSYGAYHAEPTPAGVLSYRLKAEFTGDTPPQLGLRGTAKITGEKVSLFYYLFRRPISALRQSIGW